MKTLRRGPTGSGPAKPAPPVYARLRLAARFACGLLLLLSSTALAGSWRALMSPGPVSKTHERTEDDCDSCHLVFKGVPDEKCLRCHAVLHKPTEVPRFHFTVKGQACIECHTDHKGRDGSQTKKDALSAFDHAKTRFPLRGAHQKIECAYCHDKPLERLDAKCGSCHEDSHKGQLGARCEKCHVDDDWKAGLRTKNAHKLSMDGGHQPLGCESCHAGGKNIEKVVPCAGCHEQAHGGTKAACDQCHSVLAWKPAEFNHDGCTCKFPGKHRTASCLSCHDGFKFTGTTDRCSGCHDKDRTHNPLGECSVCHSPLTWKDNKFDHNGKRSKFPLADEHLAADCVRCHAEVGGKRQFRGTPSTCEGCHKDEGDAVHGDFGACAKCHTTKGFDKPTFDHAKTGFPIDGRHSDLGCQDCHASKVKGYPGAKAEARPRAPIHLALASHMALAEVIAGVALGNGQDCAHCHRSPHEPAQSKACADCHGTADWRPSSFDLARHEKTRLPLTGAHQKIECRQCHVGLQLSGLPLECAGCHVDVHREKLGADCARCHSTASFAPVPSFEHAMTGFALVGRHAELGCAKCHGDATRPNLTRTATVTCAGCHTPQHGDFGACADCHAPTDASFTSVPGFDHDKTAFRLERRHQTLPCAGCHPKDGPPAIARCASCHVDPHSGGNTLECQDCHAPDRWRLARFDHDQTGWPLRGRHFVTPCASCHTNQRWFGLPTDCFDCHALDAARAMATIPEPHRAGPTDCQDCHFSAWRWRGR